jgi:hypothetical protein
MNPLRTRHDPAPDASPDRPPIWVTGRQRPSFDLRAYGAYSLIATRAALGPGLIRMADRTAKFQGHIAGGAYAIDTTRLGKAAAYLPTRPGIVATIGGVSAILQDAAQVVLPAPAIPESLEAYDALWRSRPVPASGRLRGVDFDKASSDPALDALRQAAPLRPRRMLRDVTPQDPGPQVADVSPMALHEAPAPAPVAPAMVAPELVSSAPMPATPAVPEDDPLFAIRDIMAQVEPIERATPARPKPTVVATASTPPDPATPQKTDRTRKPLPGWTKPVLRLTHRASVLTLAWTLTAVAMPIGLVKAVLAHLDGRDLRDLVEDR